MQRAAPTRCPPQAIQIQALRILTLPVPIAVSLTHQPRPLKRQVDVLTKSVRMVCSIKVEKRRYLRAETRTD